MPIYSFEGVIPVVHPSAYVHPTAILVGDVIVGPGCYVGPAASLRGDFGRLVLEEGANVQDTCVMHGFPGIDTVVEREGHIGHGAVLHSCRVKRNAMVGINAVVMDNAVVGEESIVAALAFVKADMTIPPRSLVAGVPARIVRKLSDQEVAWKSDGTSAYRKLAVHSLKTMKEAAPLAEPEPDRPRLVLTDVDPLFLAKRKFTP
ncbi:MAG: phenylacetic acid degradation protein PaaY [Betaproteobacteria bacterium]|nr:phenylacetic acid degradation protein PaaY [Betaproteobacteria bacterium]